MRGSCVVQGGDALPGPNPHFGLYTYFTVKGASIPKNALGPRAAVRSIVAACGGHGAIDQQVDHEQLLAVAWAAIPRWDGKRGRAAGY